jgi:hypothetical protein
MTRSASIAAPQQKGLSLSNSGGGQWLRPSGVAVFRRPTRPQSPGRPSSSASRGRGEAVDHSLPAHGQRTLPPRRKDLAGRGQSEGQPLLPVGRAQVDSKRGTLAVDHKVALCARFAAIRRVRAHLRTPFGSHRGAVRGRELCGALELRAIILASRCPGVHSPYANVISPRSAVSFTGRSLSL